MMKTQSKETYLMLFRGPHWDRGLTLDQLEQVMSNVTAWFEGLQSAGKVKGGQPLAAEGRLISGAQGRNVSDGPFAESKEVVGGYLLLGADNFEEAFAIAKSCPTLEFGISIELRPLLEECPVFKRANERLANATA